MIERILIGLSTIALLTACGQSEAQQTDAVKDEPVKEEPAKAEAEEKPAYSLDEFDLGQGVYMLQGRGGNIGVSTGPDGVFVIDDQFADLAPAIISHIEGLSDGSIRFVINTHYHGDHTGGNEVMKDTGATVVAHDNVRARMGMTMDNKLFGRTVEATDPALWPTLTFSENLTFHFNGQTIDVVHTPGAHTDGDAIIYFREADILHMGDNFFNGLFPYVDIDGGGSLQGMIAASETALTMIGPDTQIIPGHGPMSSQSDLQAYRDLLTDIQARVAAKVDDGMSLQEIIDARPLEDYSELLSLIHI